MRIAEGARNQETRREPKAPSACPACGSRDMTTTSKAVTVESYWRCVSCGEVWNQTRREASHAGRSRWFPVR